MILKGSSIGGEVDALIASALSTPVVLGLQVRVQCRGGCSAGEGVCREGAQEKGRALQVGRVAPPAHCPLSPATLSVAVEPCLYCSPCLPLLCGGARIPFVLPSR